MYAETGMLMSAYMNLLYVLPLALVGLIANEKEARIINTSVYLLSMVIMMIMVVFIGVFVRVVELEQTKTQALAYQMESRIESIPSYAPNMKVLVVGRPHNGNYPFVDERDMIIVSDEFKEMGNFPDSTLLKSSVILW